MKSSVKIYEEERPWGSFRQFTENASSTVKIITVSPNKKLSLQSHKKREEFWKVVAGSGFFQINKESQTVSVGDERIVPVETLHRIEAGSEGMTVLEISTGEFEEGDITRYEDDYGRV